MDNINIKVGEPVVCITKYKEDNVTKFGLSIRYYHSVTDFGVNKVSSYEDLNSSNPKTISFSEFAAIVPYKEFDPSKPREYYITNYKVK